MPLSLDAVQVGPADADGADPDDDLVVARLLELDLAHLERPSSTVKDGGSSLHFVDYAGAAAPIASSTAAQVVTVETFCKAKLIDALCHSAFIVEQPSSGTIM